MAAIDHSKIYREFSLRNLPHLKRKKDIVRAVRSLRLKKNLSYADYGCSNGYLTKIVADLIGAKEAFGFDHTIENLKIAKQNHPDIEFRSVDLNIEVEAEHHFDFITCFETLEHVGRPEAAIMSLMNALKPSGQLLLSLPIEVGPVGILKFAVKNYIYGYSLDEISQEKAVQRDYVKSLMSGRRLGHFREKARSGWGTHYGFDFRDFEDLLNRREVNYRAWSSFATRFCLITK